MVHPSYYCVGVDLGTTRTAAAVCRPGAGRPYPVPLDAGSATVASAVFLAPDGALICGEAAQERAAGDPRRMVREFTRRIGDGTPLLVGDVPVPAESVAARFVGWVLQRVAAHEGAPATRVAITHPAEWGPHRCATLTAALTAAGTPPFVLTPAPVAAAIGLAGAERITVGGTVAVYDLGGRTFGATVVRRIDAEGLGAARFEILGRPVGLERIGGLDFDELVFEHIRAGIGDPWERLDLADPAVPAAVARLRRACTVAKESLSVSAGTRVPVRLPGLHTEVGLRREELAELIRPAVVETVEALQKALAGAGVEPAELEAVLLAGGSSRIPLVGELVAAELGRPVAGGADPGSIVAIGAAVAAGGAAASSGGPAGTLAGGADSSGTDSSGAVPVAADRARTDALPVLAAVDGSAADPPTAALPVPTALETLATAALPSTPAWAPVGPPDDLPTAALPIAVPPPATPTGAVRDPLAGLVDPPPLGSDSGRAVRLHAAATRDAHRQRGGPADPPPLGSGSGRAIRLRAAAVVAGVGLAASLAVGIAVVTTGGERPGPPPAAAVSGAGVSGAGVSGAGVSGAAAPVGGAASQGVDAWTGEPPVDTSLAGPKRPLLLAAAGRPGVRTGLAGVRGSARPTTATEATRPSTRASASTRTSRPPTTVASPPLTRSTTPPGPSPDPSATSSRAAPTTTGESSSGPTSSSTGPTSTETGSS